MDSGSVLCDTQAASHATRETLMNLIDARQKDFFVKEGYLLLEDFYDVSNEIEPVLRDIHGIIERVALRHGIEISMPSVLLEPLIEPSMPSTPIEPSMLSMFHKEQHHDWKQFGVVCAMF